MKRVTALYSMTARRPFARLTLTAFMALALLLQGFVTQTHIHTGGLADGPAAASAFTTGAADHHNAPSKEDPAKCPLCQQAWRAGQFLAPGWLTPILLLRTASVLELPEAAGRIIVRVSHNWHGRAPPLS